MTNSERNSEPIALKIPDVIREHPAWVRLEEQLNWYDRKSHQCQREYKRLKIVQILLAVAVPLLVHLPGNWATWLTSIAGGLIAVIEAIQHMNQYATLWIAYRSTAENLKHEKYLFLSGAGPYVDLKDTERLILLSERVEEHVSTEHANWFNETRKAVCSNKREPA